MGSYSEVTAMIEELGWQKAFETIYFEYKSNKEKYEETKKAFETAEIARNISMGAADNYLRAAVQRGVATKTDRHQYIVRRIIGDEVVYFRHDGTEDKYYIGYDPLTILP